MGRPSKLTPAQWLQVEQRHTVGGESLYALSQEFGMNESSLRRKIRPNLIERKNGVTTLRDLATKKVKANAAMVEVDAEIEQLPFTRQVIVADLVHQLTAISSHLASAAEFGASTAHRLASIANTKAMGIEDVETSGKELAQIDALTRLSNSAASTGLVLLAANKDTMRNPPPANPNFNELSDEQLLAIATDGSDRAADPS